METSIIIAGDYCAKGRVLPLLGQNKIISEELSVIIKNNDAAIVNLECPVVTGNEKPITKEGPNLSCSTLAVSELANMGFNVATLANNHIRDFGSEGIVETINTCKSNSIQTVGVGQNFQEAANFLLLSLNETKVALINCCEHEYSISLDDDYGANPLNPVQQYRTIQEAQKQADYVIVIVHGGIETYQLPTPRMKEIYRFFVDVGADAVVNHHQHCYLGYEVYNKKPIFYGLGNFCFEWMGYGNDTWYEGYMVRLKLHEGSVAFELYPYIQCKDNPIIISMNKEEQSHFNERISKLNSIISNDELLKENLRSFVDSSSIEYQSIFEPYTGRLLNGLYWRHLLPSTLTKKRIIKLVDYIGCESHHESVLNYLYSRYNDIKDE